MRKISAIKKSIDTLSRNTKTLRDKYHVALCEVAGHAFEHGDPRLFDNILNAASGMNQRDDQVDQRQWFRTCHKRRLCG